MMTSSIRFRIPPFVTLIFITAAVAAILFPVASAVVRPRRQEYRQRHQRHVTLTVNDGLPRNATVGTVDQSSSSAARYAILSATDDVTPLKSKRISVGDLFDVDAVSGVVSTKQLIDSETICSPMTSFKRRTTLNSSCVIEFNVIIRNGAPVPTSSAVVTVTVIVIDVNDNAPSFYRGPQSGDDVMIVVRDVSESTPVGELAFRLPVARDADTDRRSNGRVAGYRLEPEVGQFRLVTSSLSMMNDVDSEEDDIQVVLTAPLDREIKNAYNLTLIAYDAGVPQLSGTMAIRVTVTDVNDNSPQFDRPAQGGYDVTLASDAAIGTSVVKVTAFDPDLGDNGLVRYRFAPRTQARFGNMFSVDPASGVISTSGQVTFSLVTSTIGLVVMAEDRGPNSVPSSTTVTIRAVETNQNAPLINLSNNSRLSIEENSPPGSFVGHVIVRDPDVGRAGEVDCAIVGVDGAMVIDENFRLVPLYGSEYRLVTGRAFDREFLDRYTICIRCRDFGKPPMTSSVLATVVITDVDDNRPIFPVDEYQFTIVENNDRGHVIGRVAATDGDFVISGSSLTSSGLMLYSLAEPDGDTAAWFSINSTSGDVTARVSFDREFVSRFEFDVIARSTSTTSGSGIDIELSTAKVRVKVTVLDVDDEPPRFVRSWYRFDVSENLSSGTEVGHVEAVDEDLAPFNSFFYRMESSDTSEAYDHSELVVNRSGDDNSEDEEDDAEYGHREESAGEGGGYFAIDPISGTIFTRRVLDRESLSHFALRVTAQSDVTADHTSGLFSDSTVVFIRVTDVNDNSPEVVYPTSGDNTVKFPKRSVILAGDLVATVLAKDSDIGANGRLSYTIQEGNIGDLFEIGQTTGTIRWTRNFVTDKATVSNTSTPSCCPCSLNILVQDAGTPIRLSATTALNVIVEDDPSCLVNSLPAVASSRRTDDGVDRDRRGRHNAVVGDTPVTASRTLFGNFTEWHVFIAVVAFAACIVLIGALVTCTVVVRRGCSSRRPRSHPDLSTTVDMRSTTLTRKGLEDCVQLKLLSGVGELTTGRGAPGTALLGRGANGSPVLFMLETEKFGGTEQFLSACREENYRMTLMSRDARFCAPNNETTTFMRVTRDKDSDSGCGIDMSPVF